MAQPNSVPNTSAPPKITNSQQTTQTDLTTRPTVYNPFFVERMANTLALSDKQRQSIATLMMSHKATLMELQARRIRNTQTLMALKGSDKQYLSKLNAASKEAGQIAAELVKQQALLHKNIMGIMTPEQAEKFNSIHQNFSDNITSPMHPMLGNSGAPIIDQQGPSLPNHINRHRRMMQSAPQYGRRLRGSVESGPSRQEHNERYLEHDRTTDESTEETERSKQENSRPRHHSDSTEVENEHARSSTSNSDLRTDHKSTGRKSELDDNRKSSQASTSELISDKNTKDDTANIPSSRENEHAHGRPSSRHHSNSDNQCEKSDEKNQTDNDTPCSTNNEKRHSTTIGAWITDKWRHLF
jgi:hypothetical protein